MKRLKAYLEEDYLSEQLRPLSTAEILKYEWRVELFLRKYKDSEPFELQDGKMVRFMYNHDVYKAVESRDSKRMNALTLKDVEGKEYRLSQLGKSTEFGGKGAGFGVKKENRELSALIKQIDDFKAQKATPTITVNVAGQDYEVFSAETTSDKGGAPKSDFQLVDIEGNPIVWISHKDGRRPNQFQQWGGVSKTKEPKIHRHPEVQAFMKDAQALFPDGIPNRTAVYRRIKDSNLRMQSVFGNEYGGKFSRQNVNLTLQGPVKLVQRGAKFEFDATHVYYNGERITGDYEPVLVAMYKGDRSDLGIKGARVVIMPIKGRKMTGEI